MKVKDVDLLKIEQLLKSVPDAMEIESIDLLNGYSLKLIAGTDELNQYDREQNLNELMRVVQRLKSSEKGLELRNNYAKV